MTTIVERPFLNPQTEALCALLGIENKINVGGQPPAAVRKSQEEGEESGNVTQASTMMEPELVASRNNAQVMEPNKQHEDEEEYDPTAPFIIDPPLPKRSKMSLPSPRAAEEVEIGAEEAAMDGQDKV